MKKKIAVSIFILLVLIIGVTSIFAYNFYYESTSRVNIESNKIIFEIKEGESLSTLLPRLVEKGIARNELAIRVYLEVNNPEIPNIVPGNYLLPIDADVNSILSSLSEGPQIDTVSLTIPEGLRGDEVADIIENKLKAVDFVFKKSEYLDIYNKPDNYSFSKENQTFIDNNKPKGVSLEGFLFGDTYVIATDARAIDIINLQIRTLRERLGANNIDVENTPRLNNFYAALTLASIVEREALSQKDRNIVADIFISRLETGEVLGSDVTLLYTVKDWTHELYQREIDDTSNPYNTRALRGLTPTPICNPSISSIIATYNPEKNDYVFFITGNDGVNYYARTYSKHLDNIRRYL